MRQLHDWAQSFPRPRAILIVSAHWESDQLGITSTAPTELVYDFGGFSPAHYRRRYGTPDNTHLAKPLRSVLPDRETLHEPRGPRPVHWARVSANTYHPGAAV